VAPSQAVVDKFAQVLGKHAIVEHVLLLEVEDAASTISAINDFMEAFSVDNVMLAHSCSSVKDGLRLPVSWTVPLDQVVITTIPVQALKTLIEHSWMSKNKSFVMT